MLDSEQPKYGVRNAGNRTEGGEDRFHFRMSEEQTSCAALTSRALALKQIGPVCAIDVPAASVHAYHPIGDLSVVRPDDASVACA